MGFNCGLMRWKQYMNETAANLAFIGRLKKMYRVVTELCWKSPMEGLDYNQVLVDVSCSFP